MGELQELIEELALSDEDMMNLIKLDEAFAAGRRPEDINFEFYGAQAGNTNGCEDGCYAEADRKISDLYRSHWIQSAECGAYGAIASAFATPAAGIFTYAACGTFAIFKFLEEKRVIREELELCLMVCKIPKDHGYDT